MNSNRNDGPAKTATSKVLPYSQEYLTVNTENTLAIRTREALLDMGIAFYGPLPNVGNVRLPGFQKNPNNKACSVTMLNDVAFITDFSTGIKRTVFASKLRCTGTLSAQRSKNRLLIERNNKSRQLIQEQAALKARRIWDESERKAISGYILDKGLLDTYGARWHKRNRHWTIALTDIDGVVHNVQRIYNNKRNGNNKWYLKGARKSGLMALIGEISNELTRICVVEGFATGATMHEQTGFTVACAMDCNNLKLVCKALRYRYPLAEIIVCGDDDRYSLKNIGRKKAIEAAKACDGKVCFPPISEGCSNCVDFNDVAMCVKCGGAS